MRNPTPCIDTGIKNYHKGGNDTQKQKTKAKEKKDWQIRVQKSFGEELSVPTTTAIAHQKRKGKGKGNNAQSGCPVLSIIMKSLGIRELDHESEFEFPIRSSIPMRSYGNSSPQFTFMSMFISTSL